MKHVLIAPILLIFASHQATAQGETFQATPRVESSEPQITPSGSSQRAYLGVQLQAGALVGNVDKNGPAQAAGIEPGDLIVRFDGKEIAGPSELLQIVAATPIGKEVAVGVIRGGMEGNATVKLGERLVLSGTALDAYRQKLGGMLQELESLGDSARTWDQTKLRAFSQLFAQFEELKKTGAPDDSVVQNLWGQLEREFGTVADNLVRQRDDQLAQLIETERKVEEQLAPLYLNYMTLQVCGERFQQFDNVKSGLRELLITKEALIPHERAEVLWNAVAENFQKVEGALERAGNVQLYAECEQVSKQATALMPRTGDQIPGPTLRKKDY